MHIEARSARGGACGAGRAVWCAMVALLGVGAGGCGGGRAHTTDEIWVEQYPAFYRPELKSIAVVPFGNRTDVPQVGEAISDRVAALLTQNGTYEVYNRQHLREIVREQDAVLAGILSADEAVKIGRLQAVQALICGDVYSYGAETKEETRYRSQRVWGRDPYGRPVVIGERRLAYPYQRCEAIVECNVVVLDTTTGRQLAAFHEPTTLSAEGSPPGRSAEDLLRAAEEDQVRRIVSAVAVTRTRIELSEQAIRTARAGEGSDWRWQRKFLTTDRRMYVVVTLPPEADRNRFRMKVGSDESGETIREEEIVWDGSRSRVSFELSPAEIAARSGPGRYVCRLLAGEELVGAYEFDVEKPEEK